MLIGTGRSHVAKMGSTKNSKGNFAMSPRFDHATNTIKYP